MIKLEPIKCENIILREFELKDSKQLYENWGKDEEVSKYMLWKNYKTIDDAINSINYYIYYLGRERVINKKKNQN